jgi:hypothetical protein
MAKRRLSTNNKIVVLSVLLLALILGLFVVNYKIGFFNINEKAGQLNCTLTLCGSRYCCSSMCINGKCQLPSPTPKACGTQHQSCNNSTPCCVGYMCIFGQCIQRNCQVTGQICDNNKKCCNGLSCSGSPNGECITTNTTPNPTSSSQPIVTCQYDCGTRYECNNNGGTIVGGKCGTGEVCCRY